MHIGIQIGIDDDSRRLCIGAERGTGCCLRMQTIITFGEAPPRYAVEPEEEAPGGRGSRAGETRTHPPRHAPNGRATETSLPPSLGLRQRM